MTSTLIASAGCFITLEVLRMSFVDPVTGRVVVFDFAAKELEITEAFEYFFSFAVEEDEIQLIEQLIQSGSHFFARFTLRRFCKGFYYPLLPSSLRYLCEPAQLVRLEALGKVVSDAVNQLPERLNREAKIVLEEDSQTVELIRREHLRNGYTLKGYDPSDQDPMSVIVVGTLGDAQVLVATPELPRFPGPSAYNSLLNTLTFRGRINSQSADNIELTGLRVLQVPDCCRAELIQALRPVF